MKLPSIALLGRIAATWLAVFLTVLTAGAAEPLNITNLSKLSSGWQLSWTPDATNRSYTVQYQDTLTDGIWRVPLQLGPFPTPEVKWNDPLTTNGSRFYRVLSAPTPARGKVLSVSLNTIMETASIRLLFAFAGVQIDARYNVQLYKVVYETVTPLGAPMVASGALCIPQGVAGPLPLVSYQHGTITQTNKAPSSMDLLTETSVGLGFATDGYVAVLPDFLGLGDSPGLHPYHHARSEATAAVDLLRAASTWCSSNSVPITNRVFLAGYSQGGHATMALLRELEMFHTNEFHVVACAPMAGAYDLSGVTATDFLSPRPKPNPYYFLYLLGAFQQVYRFGPDLASLLAPPYNTTLPPLLNGVSTGADINKAMPADPVAILRPELLAEFKSNPRHPLWLALQDNDVLNWVPRAPLRFWHCGGDQDVLPANTDAALAYLRSVGRTDVTRENPLPLGSHGDCSLPSMLGAKAWFDTLR